MRGREFLMKDLYSFSADEESHAVFYEKVKEAYRRIFDAVGIGEQTFLTRASGGSFSKFSHEFQTLSSAGEDTIYVSDKSPEAINEEILKEPESFEGLGVSKEDFRAEKSIEVGNIFNLGTRFSEALELTFLDQTGKPKPVVMGSYGIGPGRVMGTIVEIHSDEKGIIWPKSVAPFQIHLIVIAGAGASDVSEAIKEANEIYESLISQGVEVLYDDRDVRPGEKFADSDLIGIPLRVVVSEKTLSAGGVEIKKRNEENVEIIPKSKIKSLLS
jgi:prolyl-tRNA synthetase